MASGFSGGAPEFYCGGGINGRSIAMSVNSDSSYRSPPPPPPQFPPGIVMGASSSPIIHQRPALTRKRALPEMQAPNGFFLPHYQQQQGLDAFFLKSAKPRTAYQTSPMSPLSPVDLSSSLSSEFSSPSSSSLSRFAIPLFRPNISANVPAEKVPDPDPEDRMMSSLQELEKQLLDDDGAEDDGVSVVTDPEWSETMQSLITPPASNPVQEPNSMVVSSSPTSSTSSSSSVASSPASVKQPLVEAAASISDGNPEKAREILARAFPAWESKLRPEQRMAVYIAEALRRRISGTCEEWTRDLAAGIHLLYDLSPCFQLGVVAANQAILDATSDLPEKIHLLDFDGGAAVQYLDLIRSLEERAAGKPLALRITNVVEPGCGKAEAAEAAEEKAMCLGGAVSVRVDTLAGGSSALTPESLGCDGGEALVVSLAFKLHRVPDESVRTDNPRDELLRRLKSLRPRVVALVEQEMNVNTATLAGRVAEACAHYGALFESLDTPSARDHPDRIRAEAWLGRQAANAVACEGAERVERCEVFGKWRARLRMAGLASRPLTSAVAERLRSRAVPATRGNIGFTVREDGGGICFGWMGRTLAVASAWS